MVLLIFYTGYGLSSFPCGLVWSRRWSLLVILSILFYKRSVNFISLFLKPDYTSLIYYLSLNLHYFYSIRAACDIVDSMFVIWLLLVLWRRFFYIITNHVGRSVDAQKSNVDSSLEEVEAQIEEIQNRAAGRTLPRFQQSQLDRLEQQVGYQKTVRFPWQARDRHRTTP